MSNLKKSSRVLHHRFAILGTVKQVSSDQKEVLVAWDHAGDSKPAPMWYTPAELIDVTGEGA